MTHHPEHSPKTPSPKTGFLAALRALLGLRGRGMPSSPTPGRRLVIVTALAVLAGAAGLSATAVPALAAGLPGVPTCEIVGIRATRMYPKMGANSPNGSPITGMSVELAPAESGPWTVGEHKASEGGIEGSIEGLTPATPYYFRCAVENSVGTTVTTPVKFTTHTPEAPEIGLIKAAEIEGLSGEGFELGTTYATFEVQRTSTEGNGAQAEIPAGIEANGAQTEYHFEYSLPESGHAPAENSPSWAPFTSGASGTTSELANPKAKLTGLAPETKYYLRLKAENSAGTATKIEPFETTPTKPSVERPFARSSEVSATSAVVISGLHTRGFETKYRFEYAANKDGPWTLAPGSEGVVAAIAPSELGASEQFWHATARIAGLSPATTYYVRSVIDNGHGEVTSPTSPPFETPGPPTALTFAVHALHGETIRVLGAVEPRAAPVDDVQVLTLGGSPAGGTFTLGFEGETTGPIPFNARPAVVSEALSALASIGNGNVEVLGNPGGPYTVSFIGARRGVNQPQLVADASGLTPSGAVAVAVLQEGLSYHTHYYFEYVPQGQFEKPGGEGGFAEATSSPAVEANQEGYATEVVGEDLPGLQAGETYRFRVVAENTTAGNPVVAGESQSVTAPTPAPSGPEKPCENESFRTGPSAHLPDCRAYEQITPTEKGGAMDIFHFGGAETEGTLTGEDGDHFLVHAPGVDWGSSPDDLDSNYVFSRTPAGWRMTSLRPEGSTSLNSFRALLFNSDLTQTAVTAGWGESKSESLDVELEAGPPGGPYELVASLPRAKASGGGRGGWVAASADFSKLILATEDRRLIPAHPSSTVSGEDLYEHSAGQLRQVNVGSGGTPLSTCGAMIVDGEGEIHSLLSLSSAHAVSADGARVFFTDNCTHDLYMRVDGVETVDIGEYAFLAGNAEDSRLVLEKSSGEAREFFLYDTETKALESLFAVPGGAPKAFVSKDLSTIYLQSAQQLTPEAPQGLENLYRYDIAAKTLHFLLPAGFGDQSMSPDGRYLYGTFSEIAGVPGGGMTDGSNGEHSQQIYRLDTVEDVVQCISCASSFDPEPKLNALFGFVGVDESASPVGNPVFASANGDYVFFDTPAALVPRDVDGERAPSGENPAEASGSYSRSSDVYEWRRSGLHGCTQVQGCLGLITTGAGGQFNALLGTAEEGRDVFFTTHESLVASDTDTAGDVYDARIGGGFPPPPPRPVECEGDACSTPAAAPIDVTPSSFTFHGAGNLLGAVLPEVKPKRAKKTKKKSKRKRKVVKQLKRARDKRRARS